MNIYQVRFPLKSNHRSLPQMPKVDHYLSQLKYKSGLKLQPLKSNVTESDTQLLKAQGSLELPELCVSPSPRINAQLKFIIKKKQRIDVSPPDEDKIYSKSKHKTIVQCPSIYKNQSNQQNYFNFYDNVALDPFEADLMEREDYFLQYVSKKKGL